MANLGFCIIEPKEMNNTWPCIFLFTLLIGCQSPSQNGASELLVEPIIPSFQHMSIWDSLLLAHKVSGAILVLDSANHTFYGNDSLYSSQAYLPASTFKIPNTLLGLAAGVLKDENTMFPWDGEDRYLDSWEKDLSLDEAFKFSCLPCYQEMARKIGPERMRVLVDSIDYGDMQVNKQNYDRFWVDSDSKISPFEQIGFLLRIFSDKMLWEDKHLEILKKIMILKSEPGYILRAKTGWSVEGDINRGWYVGRLEKEDKVFYFATHVSPIDQAETSHFGKARIDVSLKALEMLEND